MRVLMVEDTPDDATVIQHTLKQAGYAVVCRVVDTPEAMRAALESEPWDVITSDHAMPKFNAPAALALAQALCPEVPLIIVSGEIDLNLAVSLMKGGAKDYIQKHELARLVPAVERELREVDVRRARRQADAALQASSARLREVLENSLDAAYKRSLPGGVYEYLSPVFDRISGHVLERAQPVPFEAVLGLLHPADAEMVQAAIAASLAGPAGAEAQVEYRICHADGSCRWLQDRFSVLRDAAGNPTALIGSVRDITASKNLEEALRASEARARRSEERLNKAQGIARVGDWVWHIAEGQVEWSDEMYCIFGIDKNSYTGRLGDAIAQVIHPDDLPIVQPANAAAFAQQKQVEYRIIWPDGTIRHISAVTGEMQSDEAGAPVYLTGTCQDITQHKQAEAALRESEERYRALVEWTPNAVLVHRDGEIMYANPAAVTLFGAASAQDLLGSPTLARVHPDYHPVALERVNQLTERGRSVPAVEEKLLRLDGTVITAEVQTTAVVYNGAPALITSIRDISKRKKIEETLQASEANLAEAQQIAQLGSWEWDMRANTVRWSAEMFRVCGIDPASYDGTPDALLKVIHPDDMEAFLHSKERNLADGQSPSLEYRVIHPDGSIHHVYANGRVEFDAAGQPVRSVGTVQDITERKLIMEALRESQTTLAKIINTVPHSIFWKDPAGVYLGCNEIFARIAGLSDPAQIVGRSDFDLPWTRAEAEAYRADDREVLEHNLPKQHIIEPVRTAAGLLTWVDTTKLPLMNAEGKPYGVLGIFEDITARKQMEEALRDSEQELHALAEAMPQIVWMTRPDGLNYYFNQRWVQFTGLSLEESYGQGWVKPFHPDDRQRAWEAWQAATQSGGTYALECRLRRADGVYTWWLIRGVPLLGEQGQILKWFGTCTDIEELKQVEAELRENRAILQAAMDHSPAGIAIADAPDGKLRYVNNTGLMIRGADRQTFVEGVRIDQYVASWQILDLDGRPLRADEVPLARALLFGETNSREFIIRRARNDDRVVLAHAAPILDEAGKVRAAIVVFTDITERKQTENKLTEQLAELRRWHKVTLGREDRILELKAEVNRLLAEAGQPPRYVAASAAQV